MSFLSSQAAARTAAPSPTPSNASGSGAKRKRPEERPNVVHSQPADTGSGQSIYTQYQYAHEHLKDAQKAMKFEEIMDYLNVPLDAKESRRQLRELFRMAHPTQRISFNPTDRTYSYRPKLDIRNTAQLKGYFQRQKSSQGLSVKDLKDGWNNVHEDLLQLEEKKEVLVKRNAKFEARTVWGNDPSLMFTMDAEFRNEWHKVQIPANPDDLRKSLIDANLKPSSAARQAVTSKPDKKKKKAPRRGGKQTNVHMNGILKDYSHLRK